MTSSAAEAIGFVALALIAIGQFLSARGDRQVLREVLRQAQLDARAAQDNAIIALGGFNPHVVNPATFGPSGMARQDEDKQQKQAAPSGAVTADETFSPEERSLREAETRYFAALDAHEKAASRHGPGTDPNEA